MLKTIWPLSCFAGFLMLISCGGESTHKSGDQFSGDITEAQKDELQVEHPLCDIKGSGALYCQMELIILNRMNHERIELGLAPLSFNGELIEEARNRACFLSTSGKFDHDGWQNRIRNRGFTPGAENIVMVHRDPSEQTANYMFGLLFNSELHRLNMESAYFHQVGIGVCNGKGGVHAVQLFTPDVFFKMPN